MKCWQTKSLVTAGALVVLSIYGVVFGADPSGITIVSPADGSVVRPGASVSVVVDVSPSLNPAKVLLMSVTDKLVILEDANAPYEFTVTVPTAFAGPMVLDTKVRKVDGKAKSGQEIAVNVVPAEAPEKIRVTVSAALQYVDGVGTTATASVLGEYPGGVQRVITTPDLGSTFASSDASVATVDAEGRIQATGVGLAVITAMNSGLKAYAPIVVRGEGDQPLPPRDMSSSVSITATGFRRLAGNLYVQQVSIRNTSELPLVVPLSLMIYNLPEGVRLEKKIGKTEVIQPLGSTFVRIEPPNGGSFIPPGAVAKVALEFSNREGRAITYQTKLVYGLVP